MPYIRCILTRVVQQSVLCDLSNIKLYPKAGTSQDRRVRVLWPRPAPEWRTTHSPRTWYEATEHSGTVSISSAFVMWAIISPGFQCGPAREPTRFVGNWGAICSRPKSTAAPPGVVDGAKTYASCNLPQRALCFDNGSLIEQTRNKFPVSLSAMPQLVSIHYQLLSSSVSPHQTLRNPAGRASVQNRTEVTGLPIVLKWTLLSFRNHEYLVERHWEGWSLKFMRVLTCRFLVSKLQFTPSPS